MIETRPRLKEHEQKLITFFRNERKSGENVLIIGDIHLPFTHKEYLAFCMKTCYEYNCDKVIFIGDLIDNHYSSYHETDPDGLTAEDELYQAIEGVKIWHNAFPDSSVIYGNHDRIIMRKAFSSGISKHWIKDFKEVIEAPTWDFHEKLVLDNVQYVHGEGRKALPRAKSDLQSTVQGHYHTDAYCQYLVGNNYKIFAMQTGCGIDHKSYAMAYARHFSKPAIGVGVVLNGGEHAFVKMMELG